MKSNLVIVDGQLGIVVVKADKTLVDFIGLDLRKACTHEKVHYVDLPIIKDIEEHIISDVHSAIEGIKADEYAELEAL